MSEHIHKDSSMPFPGFTHLAGSNAGQFTNDVTYAACGRRVWIANLSEQPTCLDCKQLVAKQESEKA